MTDVTRTRVVAVDPEAVWDVLADFGAISTWADNVAHSCVLECPDGSDPIGRTRRVQVGRNALVERIVEFEAPSSLAPSSSVSSSSVSSSVAPTSPALSSPALSSLAYDIEGLPPRLRTVRNRWRLATDGNNRTLVSLTTTVEIGHRPPQRLAERVVARVMARQSDVMLAGLAAHLEENRV